MKYRVVVDCFYLLLVLCCTDALASWQIDAQRFHVSIHGQMACTDCHLDASDPQSHPDPANVNKSLSDFFTADTCETCHESVTDYVDAGEHGGKTVNNARDIENCLACHDPHYDLGSAVPDGFDPSVPVNRQCGICHEKQGSLPLPDKNDEACMTCHGTFDKKPDANEEIAGLCFHCHGDGNQDKFDISFPFINVRHFQDTPHAGISCMDCHTRSAGYGHGDQPVTDCRHCHSFHDEKTAHDAHIRVSCQACHLGDVVAVKDRETDLITHDVISRKERPSEIHDMIIDDESSCTRCHYAGNDLGASAMVLPAKSLICMPCHTATFSIGDGVTRVSLVLFGMGMFSLFYGLLAGGLKGAPESTRWRNFILIIRNTGTAIFSSRVITMVKALLWDALCQRKLFTQSPGRWVIHALIFYPFVFRFSWGITTLILSNLFPDLGLTRGMLDKNHPIGAFLFDITGLMAVVGACLAVVLKKQRPAEGFGKMPTHDWIASTLFSAIILAGFILEGMRIAMTGFPQGTGWAFMGYCLAGLFAGMTRLADIYGYLWYAHAVLTGLFVAYLPFSRMLHMITAPVVMTMNMLEKEKEQDNGDTGLPDAGRSVL